MRHEAYHGNQLVIHDREQGDVFPWPARFFVQDVDSDGRPRGLVGDDEKQVIDMVKQSIDERKV
jgi:hypothetical protein